MRFLLLLLGFTSLAVTGFAKDALAPSAQRLFAWYDRLGFEDLSKAKFARIWTGQWVERGEENQLEQDSIVGFVLEDDGKTFRAVLGDLTGALLTKHGVNPGDREFCGYQEISLKEEAERLLKGLENSKYFEVEGQKEEGTYYGYFNRLPISGRVFVIARECSRWGLKDLGNQLVSALARHPTNDTLNSEPFPGWLKEQLAYVMLWRGWIAYRDPACSWTDLRAIFQRIVDQFPRSYWKPPAEKRLKEITALLEAEKARKRLAPEDPEELVWRLHEEIADRLVTQTSLWDYWPRPYPFKPRQSVGVIAALRAKGDAAVPALLTELRRPPRTSRSAYRFIRHGGSVDVDDTHTLAMLILEDIAGFSFGLLATKNSKEAEMALVEDWWKAVQHGEERAWLLRHAQAGEKQADAVETALMARNLADAFESTAGAIRLAVKDPSLRHQKLNQLLALKDSRTNAFLLKEFTNAQTREAETAFAYALRRAGSFEAERRILDSFREYAEDDFEKAAESLKDTPSDQGEASQLTALRFLLSSHSEETWRAIMEKWPIMPLAVRAEVVSQLAIRLSRAALYLH